MCTADILSHGNITQEILQEALNVLSQRPTVVHRREAKDCWVNPYNPALLHAWNGNMDIQFILDPYSCIMYIISYITKAEKELGELIKAAQREARQNNEEAIQELRKLGNVYLTHREISVMEAVYRVCGLKLKHCSRDVVWIPTDTENTRITLPMHVIKSNASRGDDNIWMTSILDRYQARPLTNEFANMCLATFVSRYRVIANSTHTEEADIEEESKTETGKKIRLLHSMGTITRRTKKDAVIRYPKFSQSKDPEKYYFNLLRLYCPHRENRFLPSEYNSFQQYYETGKLGLTLVCNIVNENMKQFQKLTDQLDETWSLMKDMPPLEEAWAQVAPNSEQERIENEEEKELLDDEEFLSAVDIPEMKSTPQTNKNSYSQNVYTEPNPNTITDEKLLQMYRLLNKEQMELLNFIKEWCLQVLHSNSHDNFHIFLTGGAGAGKSLLIHCIYHMANKLFHKIRETPDDVIILKVAYTGKAALNINGQTIHSAFALKKNMKTQYQPLGENDLNTLRARLSNIQLLIIDEISMVSKTVLSYISGRLNQIKSLQQNSKPFGGISVLCVGDFYQIPPVFGKSLLCVDAGALPQDLWTLFKVHKLQKIMRQKEDLLFAEALNIIRTKGRDDPMNQDVENLLRSRLETSNCPSDAIHIFSTNEQVRHHNLSKLQQLGKPIISMTAVDILHSPSGKVFQRQTPFENLDTCLQSELKLATGARVMLTVNIDTSDGLVNGTLGTVIDIVSGSMPYGFPEYIVLQFDDEHIGNNYRIRNTTQPCNDKCVPFRILSQKVPYKTGYITRFQFPFTLSWACTIHKVQGQTFKEVAVSLKRVFKGGMAYVALSRVTHLKGLHLLDYDPSVIYADSSVKQSLDQMEVLSLTDCVLQPNEREDNFLLLHHNVQSLRKHFPDVKKMLEFYSPNVFCATETWLGEDSNQTCYDVDGFNLESVNSVQDRGAGAAVYIKIDTSFHIVKTDAKDDYEMICIFFPKISTMVATVYRHCNASLASFLHVPQCLLDICKTNNIPKIVVLGDFNNSTGEISRSFLSLEFQQVIHSPTTIAGSTLDNIFICNIPSFKSGVLSSYFSFHLTIYISINIREVQHVKAEKKKTSVKANTKVQPIVKRYKNLKNKKLITDKQQIPDKRKTIVGFEADSFTPHFPLPYTPFMTTLYQHLGLTARVVDMWCGNNNTLHLVQWLQTVGFNVVPTLGTQQYSVSCGYVAANTAWIFHNTNNWLEVEIQPTLDKCIIHQYNSIIGIPGHEPTFLMDTQIIEILAHLHNAESSSVPFTWIDGPMPINFFILGLRRSLSGRKTRKDSNLRIAIVNTTPTDSSTVLSGDHWITVAYKLCSV